MIVFTIIICLPIIYFLGWSNFILVFAGATLSVLIVLIIDHLRKINETEKLKKIYIPYEGRYSANTKEYFQDVKGFPVYGFVDVSYENHKFIVQGIVLNESEKFSGEIDIDRNLTNSGKGGYKHEENKFGYIGFGLWSVILFDAKTILVESQYSRKGEIITQPMVWRKIKQEDFLGISLEELKEKCLKKNQSLKNSKYE